MKLVRSDSPEVVRNIASAGAWASRNWTTFVYGCTPNVLILLIAITVSLSDSVRAAALLGVPVFLAWNVYVLWHTKYSRSSRSTWVIAGCDERVYVRLFARPRGNPGDDHGSDVLVLEVSEIASMSIKTLEVFVYGPDPNIVEWLVIEPVQAVGDDILRHISPLLTATDPDNAVLVAHDEGRLTIEWKWYRPALRVFLQNVVQECPSVLIATEDHSELDLNGIWQYGSREKPNAQQRQMLVQAKRLGFGGECTQRISQYKHMSLRKASAYLAEIARDDSGLDCHTEQQCEQEKDDG